MTNRNGVSMTNVAKMGKIDPFRELPLRALRKSSKKDNDTILYLAFKVDLL